MFDGSSPPHSRRRQAPAVTVGAQLFFFSLFALAGFRVPLGGHISGNYLQSLFHKGRIILRKDLCTLMFIIEYFLRIVHFMY